MRWTVAPLLGSLFLQGILIQGSSPIAQTPQMGWDTWNAYQEDYNITTIQSTVDLFHSLGLTDAGYEYINLDDGWSAVTRSPGGYLQANLTVFPDGMEALANLLHSNGLKLGLYGDSGALTCAFRPGSWGYEKRDALTLASWGVDHWKYDNCGGFAAMVEAPQVRYNIMQDALLQSGRDIVYSVCEWGYQFPWRWGGNIGHAYRVSGDIEATFINETGCACKTAYCLNTGYAGCSIVTIINKMKEISPYQTPGHWADMDMLEIGNGNFTIHQQQTHFAFWSALKSPLIIGTDLAKLSNESVAILTNKDIISLNQDPLGIAATYIANASVEGYFQVWGGKIKGGNVVLLFNEKSYPQIAHISLPSLGLGVEAATNVVELWSRESLGTIANINSTLQPYQTLVFKLQD